MFFEAGSPKFGSVAKSNRPPSINFSFTKMFCRGLTLAPGCRAWIWVKVFAFWVGKIFIRSFKFSPAVTGQATSLSGFTVLRGLVLKINSRVPFYVGS